MGQAKASKKAAAAAEAAAKAAEEKANKAKEAAEKDAKEAKEKGAQAKYIKDHIKESKCENNKGCASLTGFCCPNLDGTTLQCCGAASDLAEEVTLEETSRFSFASMFAFCALLAAGAFVYRRRFRKVSL